MTTLISADNSWALWTIMVGIAAISIYLEQNYKWAGAITGAILGMLGAMALSNLNVIPVQAPVYDVIWDYVVPLAIPMLIFNANIRRIWRESGRLMFIFCISSAGTILGTFIAFFALRNYIPELYRASAMMAGTYIGGGVNFAAMAETFGASADWVSALTVADNLLMGTFFFVLLAIPSINFFLKRYTHPHIDEVARNADKESATQAAATQAAKYWGRKEISLKDIAFNVMIAFAIVWISTDVGVIITEAIPPTNFFTEFFGSLFGNKYLLITTITVLLATFAPNFMGNLHGSQEIGTFLIYIFLVVLGVPASISLILQRAPLFLLFAAIIVFTNLIVTMVFAKLLKFNLEEALVACNANVGGPTTAAAMAIAKGWEKLVAPAMLSGVFGYIIGNYLGVFVGTLLSRF